MQATTIHQKVVQLQVLVLNAQLGRILKIRDHQCVPTAPLDTSVPLQLHPLTCVRYAALVSTLPHPVILSASHVLLELQRMLGIQLAITVVQVTILQAV